MKRILKGLWPVYQVFNWWFKICLIIAGVALLMFWGIQLTSGVPVTLITGNGEPQIWIWKGRNVILGWFFIGLGISGLGCILIEEFKRMYQSLGGGDSQGGGPSWYPGVFEGKPDAFK